MIYIHQTDLVDIFRFNFSRQMSKYLLPKLESGNLQLEQTNFTVFCQNFQILGFSLRGIFCTIFPVFPVQWLPSSIQVEHSTKENISRTAQANPEEERAAVKGLLYFFILHIESGKKHAILWILRDFSQVLCCVWLKK